MRARGRHLLSAIASGVLHAAPVLWGALRFVPDLDLDHEFEFTEVELIDPDKVQGTAPPPPKSEPTTPEPAKPEPAKPEPAKPEPAKPEPAKPEPGDDHDLGERRSKVDQLGPTNSTFYAMLVPKKIRKLSFREPAVDLMAPLPDFDYLIAGGGFDALGDFEYIVIASPDIRDWRQTFLAVEYKMSRDDVMRAIERAARRNDDVIEWIEENGIVRGNPRPADGNDPDLDARWFVLLPDRVAVYVREEFLPQILADEVGSTKTSGNFVANLARLRRFAATQPTAGLQLVMKDIRAALKRVNLPFEAPNGIELSVEATEDPELFLRVEFASVVDAKAAENWWKEELPNKLTGLKGMMIKSMVIDMLEVDRVDRELHLWGRFETKQAAKILEILAGESARMLKKTPEDLEAQRRERNENWLKRNRGKLGPASLDAGQGPNDAAGGAASPSSAAPAEPTGRPNAPEPHAP